MRNNLIDKVDLRLGSGIEVLKPNEVDEIIIAGMGGMLINDILKANEDDMLLTFKSISLILFSSIFLLVDAITDLKT